ncbi:MAG TPA: cytochrome c [Burkholderiales bacterium]|nr:cytochrome c [Burkholderiales bacterium]
MRILLAVPLLSFLAFLSFLVVPPVHAQTVGNAEAAKGKNSMCIGCHGIPMYKTVYPEVYSVPMIAGQSPDYIVKALQAYRTGDRGHPSMRGIAKSLSDQDMADLAAYYGGPGKAGK